MSYGPRVEMRYTGLAYRIGEPSMPKDKTVREVLEYEKNELGNRLETIGFFYASVTEAPATDFMWVYLDSFVTVQNLGDLPPEMMISYEVHNSLVIATDHLGGWLIRIKELRND